MHYETLNHLGSSRLRLWLLRWRSWLLVPWTGDDTNSSGAGQAQPPLSHKYSWMDSLHFPGNAKMWFFESPCTNAAEAVSLCAGIWWVLQIHASRKHKFCCQLWLRVSGCCQWCEQTQGVISISQGTLLCPHSWIQLGTSRWTHLLHPCGWHFPAVELSPFLPLSCLPSKFSSNWKVAFWHYFLVPEVFFFFYFLSLFFSWCSGCFIHPGSCAELFPFLITPRSNIVNPACPTLQETQFSLQTQCPGCLPSPSLLCGRSTCRKCWGSFGTAWALSWRKYPKLWNASLGMLLEQSWS